MAILDGRARVHPDTPFGCALRVLVPRCRRWVKVRAHDIALFGEPPREEIKAVTRIVRRRFPAARGRWLRLDFDGMPIWVRYRTDDTEVVNAGLTEDSGSFSPSPAMVWPASWLFLLLGVGALGIGLEEVGWNATQGVTGLMFVLVGLLALAASYGLAVPDWAGRWRHSLSRLGGFALLGASLYLAGVSLFYFRPLVVIWAICIVATGLVVRALLEETFDLPGSVPDRTEASRDTSSSLSIVSMLVSGGVSLGLVWSVVQFVYVELVSQPPGPSLAVAASLTRVPEGDTTDALAFTADIDVENGTNSKIVLVGSLYRVSAIAVGPNTDPAPRVVEQAAAPRATELSRVRRNLKEGNATPVDWGPVAEHGWYFEPNEKHRWQFVVLMPRTDAEAHPLLRLTVELDAADASRLSPASVAGNAPWIDDHVRRPSGTLETVKVRRVPIPPPGLLHLLTRGKQQLVSVEFLPMGAHADNRPRLVTCITQESNDAERCGDASKGDVRRWRDYYRLVNTSAKAEVPL